MYYIVAFGGAEIVSINVHPKMQTKKWISIYDFHTMQLDAVIFVFVLQIVLLYRYKMLAQKSKC